MGGRPLATGAVTAAAVAFRAPDDFSVVSFAKDSVVVKSQDGATPVDTVVDGVLALRGHGTTDLAGALRIAGQQLARSSAGRKIAVLLSDCRATEPGDVESAAAALDELAIIAPAGDDEAALALAGAVGAALTTVEGPERGRRGPPARAGLTRRTYDQSVLLPTGGGTDARAVSRRRPDRRARQPGRLHPRRPRRRRRARRAARRVRRRAGGDRSPATSTTASTR